MILVWSLGFVAVIHYFISPLLVAHGFIPLLLSNLLFMIGASYYHYVNFLGYDGKLYFLSCSYLVYNFCVDCINNLRYTEPERTKPFSIHGLNFWFFRNLRWVLFRKLCLDFNLKVVVWYLPYWREIKCSLGWLLRIFLFKIMIRLFYVITLTRSIS